ncbi:MAG: S9 family peptidase [Bacteroidales bacterium]
MYILKPTFLLGATTLLSGLLFLGTSCKNQEGSKSKIIGKTEVKVENRRLSPEVLWALGRLGEVSVSPNGKQIAYTVRYFSLAENKGNTDIYIMDVDGSNSKQITATSSSEWNIQWRPDGKKIGFLNTTDNDQGGQIFEMDADGKNVKQISHDKEGIDGFKYSPNSKAIALIKQIKSQASVSDRYPDLDKSSGMIYTDLNYRHWDEWVSHIPHIFIASIENGKVGSLQDILEGEPYEAPVKPFGDISQYSWSTDGKTIVYTSRKYTGKDYALSTNTDIYSYDLASKQTVNLSEAMMGYDQNPVFSPNGQYLAWESQQRDGYESDKIRLILLDLHTGIKIDATKNFDQNANGLSWSKDSKKIYFVSDHHALDQIYALEVASATSNQTPTITKVTDGVHDYTSVFAISNQLLIGTRMSMSYPAEIFSINLAQTNNTTLCEQKQISTINTDLLSQLDMGRIESRWITTTDQKSMLTWIIYPPHFDSTKKYPTLLYCEGGPQSTVSQFWSFRWNFQIMAANDYIIVAPNRRGLPGFGQAWLEQISGDYGGQNMKDYLSAIDALCKESYVDKDRLGCVGASYGAFSVYWLAGHHQKRFKGFIAHDGMFNLEQQYLETEEMWFTNWDLGGPYWDKKNAIAQRTYANSPHLFVENWDTPIFIIHGEKDYRILASQGMSAFNAAILRGIPAELLIFPDENHWVLQPQNGILWQRRFFRFLDKYVKGLSNQDLQKKHHAESSDMQASAKLSSNKEKNTERKVAQ